MWLLLLPLLWLIRRTLRPRGGTTMPDADPLATVEHQITDALAELREARVRHEHSPNVDSELWVQQAQTRLDMLIDRRQRIRAAEVVAEEMVR